LLSRTAAALRMPAGLCVVKPLVLHAPGEQHHTPELASAARGAVDATGAASRAGVRERRSCPLQVEMLGAQRRRAGTRFWWCYGVALQTSAAGVIVITRVITRAIKWTNCADSCSCSWPGHEAKAGSMPPVSWTTMCAVLSGLDGGALPPLRRPERRLRTALHRRTLLHCHQACRAHHRQEPDTAAALDASSRESAAASSAHSTVGLRLDLPTSAAAVRRAPDTPSVLLGCIRGSCRCTPPPCQALRVK
jgi:hypothetical protein